MCIRMIVNAQHEQHLQWGQHSVKIFKAFDFVHGVLKLVSNTNQHNLHYIA
jgi:hypothetical protein